MFCIVRDFYVASFTCGIVHFYGFTRSILHQHHKSLQQFHWFFTNLTWCTLKRFVSIIHLWKRQPNVPGSFLSSASDWRYSITRDERVRFLESETLFWIHCENNFMNSYVTTVWRDAKCKQKLTSIYMSCWTKPPQTSVSTVSMATFLHPFCTASAASRSKRVSVSSCEHGERRHNMTRQESRELHFRLLHTVNCSLPKEVEQLPVKGMQIIRLKLSTDAWFKHFVSNLGTLLMFHDLPFEPQMFHRQFFRQQH